MKKVVCIFTLSILLIGLSACGGSSGTDRQNPELSEAHEENEVSEDTSLMDGLSVDTEVSEDVSSLIDDLSTDIADELEEKDKTYESILAEYTQKLQEATPGLIEEYKAEAEQNTEGLNGLAEICDDKISILADISVDGTEEMAELMMTSGSGKYEEYEEWAFKLNDIYMEEAQKITDAYMESAM